MKCPNCGAPRNANDRFCIYCKTDYDDVPTAKVTPEVEKAQSPVVHVHVHQDAPKPQPEVQVQRVYVQQPLKSDRNRLIAFILCLLLGGLGIHKFYLGKTGMGVLYIFTGGLCGIGCLVDLIVLLVGMPVDGRGLLVKWN